MISTRTLQRKEKEKASFWFQDGACVNEVHTLEIGCLGSASHLEHLLFLHVAHAFTCSNEHTYHADGFRGIRAMQFIWSICACLRQKVMSLLEHRNVFRALFKTGKTSAQFYTSFMTSSNGQLQRDDLLKKQ